MGRVRCAVWLLAALSVGPARGSVATSGQIAEAARLGGLGTGWIAIRADGGFGRSALAGNLSHPTGEQTGSFAAIWTEAGGKTDARVLAQSNPYGLPACKRTEVRAHFPFVDVAYLDDDMPVSVSLRAYAPIQLHDPYSSGLPVLIMVYTVRNMARAPVGVSLLVSWQSLLGLDAIPGRAGNRTGVTAERAPAGGGAIGIRFSGPPLADRSVDDLRVYNARGSQVLLAEYSSPGLEATTAAWNALDPAPGWWSQFGKAGSVSGSIGSAVENELHPAGCVAVKTSLRPAETRTMAFAIGWHSPRVYDREGTPWRHPYAETYPDAEAVARRVLHDRNLIMALGQEWQAALERSGPGSVSMPAMCEELEEVVAGSVFLSSENGPDARAMRFGLQGSNGAISGADRARLQSCLLASFPSLDALELVARVREAAGAEGVGPGALSEAAWLIRMTAFHHMQVGSADWLSGLWDSIRLLGRKVLDAVPTGTVGTAPLLALADLASQANDREMSEQCQRGLASASAHTIPDDPRSAWLDWQKALGCAIDGRTETLVMGPQQGARSGVLTGPVFGSRFWGTYTARVNPARSLHEFRLDRVIQWQTGRGDAADRAGVESPFERIRRVRIRLRGAADVPGKPAFKTDVALNLNPLQCDGEVYQDGDLEITLADAIALRPGDRLSVILRQTPEIIDTKAPEG